MDISSGTAPSRAATTRRIEGTMVKTRSTRKTRKALKTLKGPDAGTNAIPTTTKSKIFHRSLKKDKRWICRRTAFLNRNTKKSLYPVKQSEL